MVRFAAVGDTGKGNTGQQQSRRCHRAQVHDVGLRLCPASGDNIYESGVASVTDPQWQTKFEVPYKDVKAPFYVTLGNHDYVAATVPATNSTNQWESSTPRRR